MQDILRIANIESGSCIVRDMGSQRERFKVRRVVKGVRTDNRFESSVTVPTVLKQMEQNFSGERKSPARVRGMEKRFYILRD